MKPVGLEFTGVVLSSFYVRARLVRDLSAILFFTFRLHSAFNFKLATPTGKLRLFLLSKVHLSSHVNGPQGLREGDEL